MLPRMGCINYKGSDTNEMDPPLCRLQFIPLALHDYKIGRITEKHASYRVVSDEFSTNCKKPRPNPCRKINIVRHENLKHDLAGVIKY